MDPKLRRFTCTRGGSNKFWEVWVEGTTMHARWGRIGTAGQQKEWECARAESARGMALRKVNEKLSKGYVEVDVRYVPFRKPPIDLELPVQAEPPKKAKRKRIVADEAEFVFKRKYTRLG